MSTQDPTKGPVAATGFVVRRKTPSNPESSGPAAPAEPRSNTRAASTEPPPKPQVTFYADEIAARIARLDEHATRLGQRFGIPSARLPLDAPPELASCFHDGSAERFFQEAFNFDTKEVVSCWKNRQADRDTGVPRLILLATCPHQHETSAVFDDSLPVYVAPRAPGEIAKGLPPRQEEPTFKPTNFRKGIAHVLDRVFQDREWVLLERREGHWRLFYHREAPALGGNTGRSTVVPLRDSPLEIRQRFLEHSEGFFRTYLDTCRERIERMKSALEQADRALAFLEGTEFE